MTNKELARKWFATIDAKDFAGGKLGEEHIEMNPMAIMAQIGAKL